MVVVVEKLVLVPRWLQVLVHLRLPVLVRETRWLSALALVFVLVRVLMVVVVLSTGVCVLGEQAHTYVNQAVAKLLTGIKADPSLQTALDLNEIDTRKPVFCQAPSGAACRGERHAYRRAGSRRQDPPDYQGVPSRKREGSRASTPMS